ncbi:putative carboxypeptidase [Longimycelium tulufanense]|uniref:Putative carboxypeptidase n=1 Tax=Longimycelium tulufanense TaxID=907463 RepID=A0A8J3CG79_9PSEU|nr:LD-carboxypeptidase [Longimycelium tulufanense]GGM74101.1 putative carboxypeptidase [Longimycelium tulufanense]
MTRPRRPDRLRPGDRVAVVAPAGPVQPDLLEAGVGILRDWGLHVEVGRHVLDRHPNLGYLAGTDQGRAADLQRAWCDPTIAAVFCARGGYGSQRLLARLDWAAMARARPKILAGSSDLTALHVAFDHRLQIVTLFAPMIATRGFVDDPRAADHLRRTLFHPEQTLVLRQPHTTALVPGRAEGLLYGGTLSLLAASIGNPGLAPPPTGALLMLEEVGEETYRLDRMLTQLLAAGWCEQVAGIALGSWTDCGPPEAVRATLVERLASVGVPVVWELGFGHCAAALTIPLGVRARMDADVGTLTLTEPALR